MGDSVSHPRLIRDHIVATSSHFHATVTVMNIGLPPTPSAQNCARAASTYKPQVTQFTAYSYGFNRHPPSHAIFPPPLPTDVTFPPTIAPFRSLPAQYSDSQMARWPKRFFLPTAERRLYSRADRLQSVLLDKRKALRMNVSNHISGGMKMKMLLRLLLVVSTIVLALGLVIAPALKPGRHAELWRGRLRLRRKPQIN